MSALQSERRFLARIFDGKKMGGEINIPANLEGVKQVAAGTGLSFALLHDGRVQSWGTGGSDPVEIPQGLNNVVRIAAGYGHALALESDGTVTGLGVDSGHMETEPPLGLNNVIGIAAGFNFSLALINDGTVQAWGDNSLHQTDVPVGLGDTKMVAAGANHGVALAYSPILNYPVNVAQDLLLIYNADSQDSVTVLNHYLDHRPMVDDANVLMLEDCPVGDLTSPSDFTSKIRDPILEWLDAHPTKRPQYWILFLDVPSTIVGAVPPLHASVSGSLALITPRTPYITHINMGASSTNDCIAYINKLEAFGDAYSPGKVLIKAADGGYGNTSYYFDDARFYTYTLSVFGESARDAVLANGVPPSMVTYLYGLLGESPTDCNQHILSAANVAGYLAWGWNGCMSGDYALGGGFASTCSCNFPGVVFTGNSNWYIIQTNESFNGKRVTHQGNFVDWFSMNAFGSLNYENTPVGAITHVNEPSGGAHDSASYFGLWVLGKNFGICSWNSGQLTFTQAVGDPLVSR